MSEVTGVNLEHPSVENLKVILTELGNDLNIANRGLLDPKDYNLEKYNDIKAMYDMIKLKGNLTALEAQAFLDELRKVRI